MSVEMEDTRLRELIQLLLCGYNYILQCVEMENTRLRELIQSRPLYCLLFQFESRNGEYPYKGIDTPHI